MILLLGALITRPYNLWLICGGFTCLEQFSYNKDDGSLFTMSTLWIKGW